MRLEFPLADGTSIVIDLDDVDEETAAQIAEDVLFEIKNEEEDFLEDAKENPDDYDGDPRVDACDQIKQTVYEWLRDEYGGTSPQAAEYD